MGSIARIVNLIRYVWDGEKGATLAVVAMIAALVIASILVVLSNRNCLEHGGRMERTGTSYVWIQSGNSGYLIPIDQYSCVGASE